MVINENLNQKADNKSTSEMLSKKFRDLGHRQRHQVIISSSQLVLRHSAISYHILPSVSTYQLQTTLII